MFTNRFTLSFVYLHFVYLMPFNLTGRHKINQLINMYTNIILLKPTFHLVYIFMSTIRLAC